MITPVLLQIVFSAFFATFLAAILRRADVWFPFTPTMTSAPGGWMGINDFIRWLLAGFFLLFLPAIHLTIVLITIFDNHTVFDVTRPLVSVSNIFKLLAVLILIVPLLGFYDIWQAIVRSTKWFYSQSAIDSLERLYPNAFNHQVLATGIFGVALVFAPIAIFLALWKYALP